MTPGSDTPAARIPKYGHLDALLSPGSPPYTSGVTLVRGATLVRRTPFHHRLEPMNQPEIWEHWAGHLAATSYEHSELVEYYAVRNAVGLLDTSPLFKYRISGPDSEALLSGLMIRDIRTCRVGQAQYTAWCDAAGFVLEDGVVLRVAEREYLITTAERNLRYFTKHAANFDVSVSDVTDDYGILALQGPHSISVLRQLAPELEGLRFFGVTDATIGGTDVIVSRTGFTGDLGYEVWVPVEAATNVFDAIWEAGLDYNMIPLGLRALTIARIEAGLLLIGVDFHSARHAWTDAQRETPLELGWDWMLRNLGADDRPFVGRTAIEAEMAGGTSRWKTVGLAIDWKDYDRLHRDAGILTPKDGLVVEDTMSIYRRSDPPWQYAGYATSFIWSSIRSQHIAIAKLPLDLAEPGSEVELEIPIIHRPANVLASTVELPFYNPARKTARQSA